jgi:hypothetical protein
MARARLNTQDKYRDKYEGMGFNVVNLEEPKQAEAPAATDNPAWKIVIEIVIAVAFLFVVFVTVTKRNAPLLGG